MQCSCWSASRPKHAALEVQARHTVLVLVSRDLVVAAIVGAEKKSQKYPPYTIEPKPSQEDYFAPEQRGQIRSRRTWEIRAVIAVVD